MNPHDALYALLLSLFSADELRRWIAYDDRRGVIVDELPGAIASKSALVNAVIDALAQHGLVDAALFAGLRKVRPGRVNEIVEVEAIWAKRRIDSSGAAGARPRPGGQPPSDSAPPTSIVNNNQSGGIFAPGATFTIGGDLIQGDKHEVHHHHHDRGDGRPRRK
ncbi:MAG: hypothetical protein H6711_08330 [Myxococcales bacterium]|nr:hypothetical protein [Myxococcales bacterium]